MTADEPPIFVIESSPKKRLILAGKRLILAGSGALMTAAAIATVVLPGSPVSKTIGVLGAALIGLNAGVSLWRLITWSGPVVTISPEGIRDIRVATGLIPWSKVTGISTWQPGRIWPRQIGPELRAMVLATKPGVEREIGLTLLGRCMRKSRRAFGIDGLGITPAGLKVDYDTLLETSQRYAQAAWDRAAVSGAMTTDLPAPPAPRR